MSQRFSRRQVLGSAGLALGGVAAGAGLDAASGSGGWSVVDSPTGKTLRGITRAADGAYAVGTSGEFLHRANDGWETVFADGPTGNNKTLYGVDRTEDGSGVWMAGSSGRLAEYDVDTGEVTTHTKPAGVGNTFTDVAAAGPADDERVLATMGSGKLVYGKHEGDDPWEWEVKETSGSYTLTAVDMHSRDVGRVVSKGSGVYETRDGGRKWSDVSPDDASNAFYTVISRPDEIHVGGDNGQIWRQDCDCRLWTPHSASSKAVRGLSARDGTFLGAGDGGRVFERSGPLDEWEAASTPAGDVLLGCSSGDTDIAVGKGGTIVER